MTTKDILYLCWVFISSGIIILLAYELSLVRKDFKKQIARFKPSPSKPTYEIVQRQFEEWTADDVLALRKFFAGSTGLKLVAICGSETLQQGMKEASGDALPRAAGMDALLRFQFNLASDKELARISGASADQGANSPEPRQQDEATSSEIRSF